jgi:outer membrane immunogenic protein
MKKLLVALSALAIGTATASAADLPSKAPPPPPPPPCVWCGFYIGLNGGWVGHADNGARNGLSAIGDDEGSLIGPFGTNLPSNNNGYFGGGQIGYNWVFPGGYGGGTTVPGGWLVGAEADIQGANLRGNQSLVFFQEEENINSAFTDSRLNWFGTVRGRFGYAWDNVLVYGTGGFAFGGVRNDLLVTFHEGADCEVGVNATACNAATSVLSNSTRTGWVVGAGAEWMFLPNWSFKIEYQYIDLGSVTQAANALVFEVNEEAPEGIRAINHVNNRFDTVRIGVNYHFGGFGGYGAPLVAHY